MAKLASKAAVVETDRPRGECVRCLVCRYWPIFGLVFGKTNPYDIIPSVLARHLSGSFIFRPFWELSFSPSLSKMKTKKRENGKRGRDRNSELDLCNKRPMSHVCQRASKRSHGGENEKIPKLSLNSRGNFSNCVRVLLLLFCTESNCDCARSRLSNSWKRFISSSPSTYFYISKSPLPNRETEHPEHFGRLVCHLATVALGPYEHKQGLSYCTKYSSTIRIQRKHPWRLRKQGNNVIVQ